MRSQRFFGQFAKQHFVYAVVARHLGTSEGITDLRTGEKKPTGLPKSNVLYYELDNDAWCCVHPSGTEPKVKFYMGVKSIDLDGASEVLAELKAALLALVQ